MPADSTKSRPRVVGCIAALSAAFIISGCASSTGRLLADMRGWSEQQVDDWFIRFYTVESENDELKKYRAISGRVLDYLLIAHAEILAKHAYGCGPDPLKNHYYLYREFEDTIRVDVTPRRMPGEPPPLPPVPEGYVRLVYKPFLGIIGLEGCEIRFTIDKETRKVVDTQIINVARAKPIDVSPDESVTNGSPHPNKED